MGNGGMLAGAVEAEESGWVGGFWILRNLDVVL